MNSRMEYLKKYMSGTCSTNIDNNDFKENKKRKNTKKDKSNRKESYLTEYTGIKILDADNCWKNKSSKSLMDITEKSGIDMNRDDLPSFEDEEDKPVIVQINSQHSLSPPRTKEFNQNKKDKNKSDEKYENNIEKAGGLYTKRDFDIKLKKRKKEENLLILNAEKNGIINNNEETVYRDRKGKKLDMLTEMMRQKNMKDEKDKRKKIEEYEWGTGAIQKQELYSRLDELEEIKRKPFARFADDNDLNTLQREKIRNFDPITSKLFTLEQDSEYSDELKQKKRKHKKKEKKKKMSKPFYKGPPAPPNRFNILPGYRWDGVVRGNGWENKVLNKDSSEQAMIDDRYRSAVADM